MHTPSSPPRPEQLGYRDAHALYEDPLLGQVSRDFPPGSEEARAYMRGVEEAIADILAAKRASLNEENVQ